MKVLSVVGNRPQFVKSAPLSLALRDAGIDEVVLHTGQHWDAELSGIFFEELSLPEPAYRLDLHTAEPDAMLPGIADALERERPDWTLVYGDTNSTLAGARAGVDADQDDIRAAVGSDAKQRHSGRVLRLERREAEIDGGHAASVALDGEAGRFG